MKILIKTIALLFLQQTLVFANQPKNWQLGFQDAASQTMRDIVWFHDYIDRKSTRLNSSHSQQSRMPSSA